MAVYDFGAILTAVQRLAYDAMVVALPALGAEDIDQVVPLAVPLTLPTRLGGYVTLSFGPFDWEATQLGRIEVGAYAVFGYRVEGAQSTAELALATATRAFIRAYADDPSLGDVMDTTTLDGSPSRDPLYQPFSGHEFRLLPFLITGHQSENPAA